MTTDELYIRRCLQLAEQGRGSVAPNPMVGAVLVYEGNIIAEGFTQPYGGAHAEVHCLNAVKEVDEKIISNSTLYVSLEPCSHFGKTPPCVDLIIEKKIKRVVIGCKDAAAHVNGAGIEKLVAAGVNVVVGVLEKECIEFNKRFFTFQEKKRPFIILKWAQSADGYLSAAGASTKITSEEIDILVHKWRTEEAAIMVGTTTAMIDNPRLTARLWEGKQPTRIMIDKHLKIPSNFQVYDNESPTIFLNGIKEEQILNTTFIRINSSDNNFLMNCLSRLYENGILSLLVEGGAKLLQSFLDQNLWDEVRIISNTQLRLESGVAAPIFNFNSACNEIILVSHSIKTFENK